MNRLNDKASAGQAVADGVLEILCVFHHTFILSDIICLVLINYACDSAYYGSLPLPFGSRSA